MANTKRGYGSGKMKYTRAEVNHWTAWQRKEKKRHEAKK